jgi:hypothetical protein
VPSIIVLVDGTEIHIPVGDTYVHLGTVISRTGSLSPEFKKRAAAMAGAVSELRHVYKEAASYDIQHKQLLVNLFLLSKGLFKSQVWNGFSDKQLNGLRVKHFNILRSLLGKTSFCPEERVTNVWLLLQEGFADLSVYVRKSRLLYFSRVVRNGPVFLKALIQSTAKHAGSWARTIISDLQWLALKTSKLDEMPDPAVDAAPWQLFILQHPKAWKAIVNQVVGRVETNEIPGAIVTFDGELPFLQHECTACGLFFSTKQGMCLHALKMHGRRSAVSRFTNPEGVCVSCYKVFHTRTRLAAHLMQGHKRNPNVCCFQNVIDSEFAPLSDAQLSEFEALDAVEHSRQRSTGLMCVKRVVLQATGVLFLDGGHVEAAL